MRRVVSCARLNLESGTRFYNSKVPHAPIIRIDNGTFYRRYPSATTEGVTGDNPALFAGLTFELPSYSTERQHWAVVGSSNAGKTTLFEVLRGQHLCIPPAARSFPHLASEKLEQVYRNPARAIQCVGFDGERGGVGRAGTRGAYLSARYESRREETDFSVLDFLKGNTELNPSERRKGEDASDGDLQQVLVDLNLQALVGMRMSNLSNGQMRRARIAKALLRKPIVLLLDEPFMGLDPLTVAHLSKLLHAMVEARAPRLILALRPQDPLPGWITHVLRLGASLNVEHQGTRDIQIARDVKVPSSEGEALIKANDMDSVFHLGLPIMNSKFWKSRSPTIAMSREGLPLSPSEESESGEILVAMKGVRVAYDEKVILGDWKQRKSPMNPGSQAEATGGLWWNVERGQRWGVFGLNGSGKTTLISLICSDHPQAYSQPMEIFGRNRLPQAGRRGISIFDIQTRIGQSSPEIHAFFPKSLSIRQTLENAWADTFLGTPRLTSETNDIVDACLRWFEAELNPGYRPSTTVARNQGFGTILYAEPTSTKWASDITFGLAPFSAQRVALFLRAIIKKPDLVVLDEAFSGMDEYVRDKCVLFLTWGETKSPAIKTIHGSLTRDVVSTPQGIFEGRKVVSGLSDDQAMICVSHVREEVPGVVRHWMRLPEAGTSEPPRSGILDRPLEADQGLWEEIWGL